MAYLRGMIATVTATAFDTLTYARRLKAAGVDEAQAEAQAEAHAEAVRDAVTEGVATKADLEVVHASLEARIDSKTADLKADMLKVAIGIVFANAGLTFALLKLLPQGAP